MSVPGALLAILNQGECYGNQLRSELAQRTGAVVNIGQVHNTLERLERDGYVARGDVDDHGHVYWRISPAGQRRAEQWLSSAPERSDVSRDDLVLRIALTTSLPGTDSHTVLTSLEESIRQEIRDSAEDEFSIWAEARTLRQEADLALIAKVRHLISSDPSSLPKIALSAERPRRGRPRLNTDA